MRKTVGLFIGYSLLHCTPTVAQRIDRTTLRTSESEFPEPFTQITGIRELSDGRVLVADRVERTLRSIDFQGGEFREIGRVGGGPGEYQIPGELLPLAGDSTLLVDFGNLRLTVITPNGRLTRSFPMMRDDMMLRPTGTDAAGRIYVTMTMIGFGSNSSGGIGIPDSAAIARWDPTIDQIDTVGFVRLSAGGRQAEDIQMRDGRVQLRRASVLTQAFPSQDAWAVAPDGDVALVRADDYRVRWTTGDGSITEGPSTEYEPVRVRQEDKEAWADRIGSGSGFIVLSAESGRGNRTLRIPRPDIDQIDWPDYKPPFPRNAARVTPEGELWVERSTAFGEPQNFDVFDRSGKRTRQITLPENRQLVGFGRESIFAVHTDEDDLQWLERYRR